VRSGIRRLGPHMTGTRSTLMRRAAVLVVLAALGAVAAMSLGTAQSGAIIRFCTTQVCIGPANGCSTTTSTGVVIQADDGDSFIDSKGRKWTCNHGTWVVTLTSGISSHRGPVLGVGEFFQGPPPSSPCDYSPTFSTVVAECETTTVIP
jgi:hypothetical protein